MKILWEVQIAEITNFMKKYRQNWEGHIDRIGSDRTPIKVWKHRPKGKISLGRSLTQWKESVLHYLKSANTGHCELVAKPRYEPDTFWIWNRRSNHSAVMPDRAYFKSYSLPAPPKQKSSKPIFSSPRFKIHSYSSYWILCLPSTATGYAMLLGNKETILTQ
jgi:hypothetical protein